jgi:hypothetical protein
MKKRYKRAIKKTRSQLSNSKAKFNLTLTLLTISLIKTFFYVSKNVQGKRNTY